MVTWQRYRDGRNEAVMDVKYSVYDSQRKSFSQEAYLFDRQNLHLLQAHPCCGYWGRKYRMLYCQCRKDSPQGKIVEVSADRWWDFHKYGVSDNEKAVTPELGFHPHLQFLPINESNAWLFYTLGNEKDKLCYSTCDSLAGWSEIVHPIPTSNLIGGEALTMGSALVEGRDIVIYGSTYELRSKKHTARHGLAYRFKSRDDGHAWSAERVTVSGIEEPFRRSGELFVRVVKKDSRWFLSSQSGKSHRYLAEGSDGIRFHVIRDFGERPSLGNAMASIEGAKELLLVYADRSNGDQLGGRIEAMRMPVGHASPEGLPQR
jgi:hypothetical protein